MRMLLIALAAGLAAPTIAAPMTMSAKLAGANEAPDPGAPKGMGAAKLVFDGDKGNVCYTLTAKGTDTPTMAHIHKGATGVAGPVVVPLETPANGKSKACATVAPDVLSAIMATPGDYYVNVHTAAFPKGAMRGQIGM